MAHYRKTGDAAWSKVTEKINSELFSLTYGAIVTQLLKDYEEVDATNEQLEKMWLSYPLRLRARAKLLFASAGATTSAFA